MVRIASSTFIDFPISDYQLIFSLVCINSHETKYEMTEYKDEIEYKQLSDEWLFS